MQHKNNSTNLDLFKDLNESVVVFSVELEFKVFGRKSQNLAIVLMQSDFFQSMFTARENKYLHSSCPAAQNQIMLHFYQ